MKQKSLLLVLGAMTALGSSAFAFTHVTADITTSTAWTVANSPYILETQLFVRGAGTVLDIEPGTIIRGQPQSAAGAADAGSLIVRPEAQIQARGTSSSPIIFTTAALDAGLAAGGGATNIALDSDADGRPNRWTPADGDAKYLDSNPASSPLPPVNPAGAKNTSYWGGLIIAGDSTTNKGQQVDIDADGIVAEANSDGFGYIEGVATGPLAVYGGVNTEHNGGIVKYVSLRHGGAFLSSGKEINGLTLYAVGSKTTISNIDIYATGDDGVEIFGGTVNLDHININYADDDGFDVDQGWQGLAQFVFILQGLGYGDNGLELDGEDKIEANQTTFGNPAAVSPVGDARIYNVTALLSTQVFSSVATTPGASFSGNSVNAARMRAGFAGQIVNSIFQNVAPAAGGNGVRIDALKLSGFTGSETVPEYENSARTYFGQGLTQVRNNAVFGFTNAYPAFTASTLTITATGAISGSYNGAAIPNVYYPSTLNRTLSTGIAVPNHTAINGIDPRPSLSVGSLAYGTTQDYNYVVSPAVFTDYKGAFDRTSSTLWTTFWTALNKRGILKN